MSRNLIDLKDRRILVTLPRMGFQQTRDGETVYYKSTRELETHL